MKWLVGATASLLIGVGFPVTPVLAQAPNVPSSDVDKSGFTLFDPTPTADLRGFSTDRPDKANSPYTVDAGHFQYETDLLNETYSRYDGVTTRVIQFADPVLKLGLTNSIDLELGFTGAQHVATSGRGVGGPGTDVWGAGDLVPRLKWNIWGNDGGATALAVIPYVKVPTASTGIGNPLVEGGALLTLGINLPYDFTAIVMTEFDDLRNGANSLTPNLQLDAATYIGLTRSSPALTVYSGLSQRF